jgi:hypothetical protein
LSDSRPADAFLRRLRRAVAHARADRAADGNAVSNAGADARAYPGTHRDARRVAGTRGHGQDYLDSIVFYGDSNTNGLRLLELLRRL